MSILRVRQRNGKLTPRAKRMHLVGYNIHDVTYRLWNPDRPHGIIKLAEVSVREEKARDVGRPKVRHDPFPNLKTVLCQGWRLVFKQCKRRQESAERQRLHRYSRNHCTKATGSKVYRPTVT